MRFCRSTALAVPTLAALALTAPASAPAAQLPSCVHLHGQDIAKGPAARIVEVPLGHGRTRLLGCAPPHGRVIALTPPLFWNEHVNSDVLRTVIADLEAVRGATAAVWVDDSRGTGDGYETERTSRRVWNLKTGRSYLTFAYTHDPEADVEDHQYDLGDAKRTLLDGHGRAVVAYVDEESVPKTTAIAAFTASGRRTVLERVPRAKLAVSSLRLTGERATWTVDGVERTADLTDLGAFAPPAP